MRVCAAVLDTRRASAARNPLPAGGEGGAEPSAYQDLLRNEGLMTSLVRILLYFLFVDAY